MRVIKTGVKVKYSNRSSEEVFTVVKRIKGETTGRPCMHGAVATGEHRKEGKWLLSNGTAAYSHELTTKL